MSEVQLSPEEIIEALPKYLIPEKAGSTKATIQFDLSGDGGGKWWMKIHDGAAEVGKGDAPEPANLTMGEDRDGKAGRHGGFHAGQAQDQRRHGPGDQIPVLIQETKLGFLFPLPFGERSVGPILIAARAQGQGEGLKSAPARKRISRY